MRKDITIESLENDYKLKVNKKKTWICNIESGFSFLGYTCKVVDKKEIVRIKRSNIEKIKKRVKGVKYLCDNGKIRKIIDSDFKVKVVQVKGVNNYMRYLIGEFIVNSLHFLMFLKRKEMYSYTFEWFALCRGVSKALKMGKICA